MLLEPNQNLKFAKQQNANEVIKMKRNKMSIVILMLFVCICLMLGISNIRSFIANAAPQTPVNLGSAANFVVLAKSGISTTGTTSIVGNIGVSPAAATYITGFGLIMDSSDQFAKSSPSSLVTGNVYAADYAAPTPTVMTTAISDMETAYTNAAGRTLPTATELGSGTIGVAQSPLSARALSEHYGQFSDKIGLLRFDLSKRVFQVAKNR